MFLIPSEKIKFSFGIGYIISGEWNHLFSCVPTDEGILNEEIKEFIQMDISKQAKKIYDEYLEMMKTELGIEQK